MDSSQEEEEELPPCVGPFSRTLKSGVMFRGVPKRPQNRILVLDVGLFAEPIYARAGQDTVNAWVQSKLNWWPACSGDVDTGVYVDIDMDF